jgi:hypothetical protein
MHVRVVGASLLRAKARADGFAMSATESAAITGELLAMLGGGLGSGSGAALGPHLALLAASVAAAGGAGTLVDLVQRALAHAAPDAAGGWPADGSMAVGPAAPAAVALLAAAAEEGLHRPRAHAYEITQAMQDCLEDVLWVLEAVLTNAATAASAAAAADNDAPHHPAAAVAAAAAAATFKCLHMWCPAGITLSELATDRPGLLQAMVHGALRGGWGGDAGVCVAATELLEELCSASDPLPGRAAAVHAVVAALGEACSELAGAAEETGWGADDAYGDDYADTISARCRAVTAVAGAVAASEAKAFANHVDGGGGDGSSGRGSGRALEWLLRAAECGGPRTAAAALLPWRRVAGGLAGALGAERGGAACERLVGGVLRRLARTAGASWRAEVAAAVEALSADRNGGGGGVGGEGGSGGERGGAYGDGAGAGGSDIGGAGGSGGAFKTDIDDDDELSLAPELEAAIAATHAALGSPRFLTLIHSALSGWGHFASILFPVVDSPPSECTGTRVMSHHLTRFVRVAPRVTQSLRC